MCAARAPWGSLTSSCRRWSCAERPRDARSVVCTRQRARSARARGVHAVGGDALRAELRQVAARGFEAKRDTHLAEQLDGGRAEAVDGDRGNHQFPGFVCLAIQDARHRVLAFGALHLAGLEAEHANLLAASANAREKRPSPTNATRL